MFLAQQQERPRIKFQLAVVLKSSQQLIGDCGIRLKAADAHEGDIGYELSPNYWGHGYATEAARAIVEFGFTRLRLHRIWSWCIAENVGSAHVLQKLGMQPKNPPDNHLCAPNQALHRTGRAGRFHSDGFVCGLPVKAAVGPPASVASTTSRSLTSFGSGG